MIAKKYVKFRMKTRINFTMICFTVNLEIFDGFNVGELQRQLRTLYKKTKSGQIKSNSRHNGVASPYHVNNLVFTNCKKQHISIEINQ